MAKDKIRKVEGEIIPPDNGTEAIIARYLLNRMPQSWGVSLLAGAGASALTYLTQPFGSGDISKQAVASFLVGAVTTGAVRERAARAICGGYLAYEFATYAASVVGSGIGAVMVGGPSLMLALALTDEKSIAEKSFAGAIGAVVGGAIGYFAGGFVAEVAAVGFGAVTSYGFNSRKMIGLAAATALGCLGATTLIKQNAPDLVTPQTAKPLTNALTTAPFRIKGSAIFLPTISANTQLKVA